MSVAIHLFSNSLWLLWDSLLYFKTSGSSEITMELDTKSVKCEFNYNETKCNVFSKTFFRFSLFTKGEGKQFQKPNGMEYTNDELYDLYEIFFEFLFSMMSMKEEAEYDLSTTLPEKFVAMCPKLSNNETDSSDHEDVFDFINFLCYLTKPKTRKKNESGHVRKESTELLRVELNHKFSCEQCQTSWKISEKVSAVNLIEFLQKK